MISVTYVSHLEPLSICYMVAHLLKPLWRLIEKYLGVTIDYINQSINQFYFLLSATSSMPLALYNGTHTLVWTHRLHIHIQWNTAHIQAFIQGSHFGADTMFFDYKQILGLDKLFKEDAVVTIICFPIYKEWLVLSLEYKKGIRILVCHITKVNCYWEQKYISCERVSMKII